MLKLCVPGLHYVFLSLILVVHAVKNYLFRVTGLQISFVKGYEYGKYLMAILLGSSSMQNISSWAALKTLVKIP